MRFIYLLPLAGAVLLQFVLPVEWAVKGEAKPENASPIYGVTIPDGYRKWELIAPALEG